MDALTKSRLRDWLWTRMSRAHKRVVEGRREIQVPVPTTRWGWGWVNLDTIEDDRLAVLVAERDWRN